MRLEAVHVCPLWESEDAPVIGMDDYRAFGFTEQPDVLGWCCVGLIEVGGAVRPFLLNLEELAEDL